jgi:hypothetical protein
VLWPTEREGEQLAKALEGADVTQVTVRVDEHSPWVQVTAWIHMEGERELALWRATGAVFAVGSDGAVEDDPFVPPAWDPLSVRAGQ